MSTDSHSLSGLHDPTENRSLREDLSRIWKRRGYVVYSSVSDLRAKEMDTVLGNLWHLLNPALRVLVYFVIFGVILGTNRGVDNFLPFVAIGVFSYSFMRSSIVGGARSIVGSRGLIQSFDFPRALLPISSTGAELAGFMPPMIVMFAVALGTGERLSWRWLLIPAILVLQVMFSLGMAFFAARLTFHFPDFNNILEFVFRMAFYFSGVLFLVDRYVTDPILRTIADLNPLLDYLSLYRWAIMDMPVSQILVVSAFGWALLALPIGYLWFRKRETSYGA
jgi:teichoic acid transport system permease protein